MNSKNKSLSWKDFLLKIINQPEFLKASDQDNELNAIESLYEITDISNLCHDWINSLKLNDNVDLQKSNSLREEGNNYFTRNEFWESIKFYTRAIFKTSKELGNNEASKAHANRAAALFQLNFYEEALNDCRCAIALGFPESIISQLYFRLANCAYKICHKEQLEFAVNMLNKMKQNNKLNSNEEKELSLLEKFLEIIKNEPEQEIYKEEPLKIKQKILKSSEKGRYVVANENIIKNDIITMENAFAFVPILSDKIIENSDDDDDEDEYFVCQNCAKENIIPFPCYNCKLSSYCSIDCRNSHKLKFHQYECPGYKRILFHKIGIGYLAFNVFLNGFNLFINNLLQKNSKNNTIKFNNSKELWKQLIENENINNKEYYNIIKLIHNIDKMNKIDILQYRVTSIMLTIYLKNYTKFFQNIIHLNDENLKNFINYNDSNFKWEIIISTLLTRHICQMICNAHTIDTLILPFSYITTNIWNDNINLKYGKLHLFSKKSKIFTAIYPNISLYNHSCESNCYNRFNNIKLIIIANRNIQKNEEIFNCYGENYKLLNRKIRKLFLKQQYHFDCNCIHCLNDASDENYNKFNSLKCNQERCKRSFVPSLENKGILHPLDIINTEVKCSYCNATFEWNWYNEFMNNVKKLRQSLSSSKYKTSDKKEIFEKLFNIFFTKSVEHISNIHLIRNHMAVELLDAAIECDLSMQDEIFSKLVDIAIYALSAIEEQYSSNGLEYISVSTYFLDLLALKKHKTSKNYDISKKYDVMKILHSFESLNMKTKQIFVRYFDNYIYYEK